jgi:hypothetical protein
MFGLGGSQSKSSQSSESQGTSYGQQASQSYMDPRQLQNQLALQQMYMNQAPQMGQLPGFAAQQTVGMQGLQGNANALGQFAGNVGAYANQGMQGLSQFARQDNPYLQNQINGLAQDAGQFYREQILPGIGGNAQLAGQFGSSRQGIAQGLGAQRVGQEFMQAAGNMRMDAYGQQQNAATSLAGMAPVANQAYGMQTGAFGQYNAMADQYANTALAQQAMPFQIGSQVITNPNVLQNSYGFDIAQQTAKSKGKSSSMSLQGSFGK